MLYKKYLEVDTIYLIDSGLETQKFIESEGKLVSIFDVIVEEFNDKHVKLIDDDSYDNMENISSSWHLSFTTFSIFEYSKVTSIKGLVLQKGLTGRNPKNTLYFTYMNLESAMTGHLSERIKWDIRGMKKLLDGYTKKGNTFEKYYYQEAGFESYLKNRVLYIREIDLDKKLNTKEKIAKSYPYSILIVDNDQWSQAIKEKADNVVLYDIIKGGKHQAINVYLPDEERYFITAFPWINEFSATKKFFKKLLR